MSLFDIWRLPSRDCFLDRLLYLVGYLARFFEIDDWQELPDWESV